MKSEDTPEAKTNSDPKVLTISIPEAAQRLGISRNSGYAAAQRGDIPVLRIGKLLRVPVAALDRKLGAA